MGISISIMEKSAGTRRSTAPLNSLLITLSLNCLELIPSCPGDSMPVYSPSHSVLHLSILSSAWTYQMMHSVFLIHIDIFASLGLQMPPVLCIYSFIISATSWRFLDKFLFFYKCKWQVLLVSLSISCTLYIYTIRISGHNAIAIDLTSVWLIWISK